MSLAPLGLTTGRRSTSWGGKLPGTIPKPSRSLITCTPRRLERAEVTKFCTALGSPMASSTARRSSSISCALMAYWAKMLREAVSRLAASSTLRVTFALAAAASLNSEIKKQLVLFAALFLDAAIGIEEQCLRDGVDD